jgi:tetratricopeptide (TPR) repeat protein
VSPRRPFLWAGVLFALVSWTGVARTEPSVARCIPEEVENALSRCPSGAGTGASKVGGERAAPRIPVIQRPAPTPAKPQPPAITEEDIRLLRGRAIAPKVKQLLLAEIAQLESLVKDTARNAADRPSLLRRLADAYVELENVAFRERIEAEDKKAPGEASAAKKLEESARAGAVRHYTTLANDHPSLSDLDQVLYHLAYEHEQAQRAEEARRTYLRLIDQAPQSRYLPNAYLAFGELFFFEAESDPQKLPLAARAYEKVLEFPPPANAVWAYASYKLGHVEWKAGNLPKALEAFKKTIEHATRNPGAAGSAQLRAGARKDIVPLYAEAGKAEAAFAFFQPLSGDGAADPPLATYGMMDSLGQSYLDTGHYDQAITLYRDLLHRDQGERSCAYHAHLVEAEKAKRGGAGKARVFAALADQVKLFREATAKGFSEEARSTCASLTAELAVEAAVAWHLEAVGTGGVRGTLDKETMKLAADAYDLVTSSFSREQLANVSFSRIAKEDKPTLFAIKYAKADLLYAQGDWERCGPAFKAAVDEDPGAPEASEARYAELLCYQKLYDKLHASRPATVSSPAGPRSRAETKTHDISQQETAMLGAFDRFLCADAGVDEAAARRKVEVKLARAHVQLETGKWEEAAVGFRDVALNHPAHEAAVEAASLYLEAANALYSNAKSPRPACLDEMAESLPRILSLHCEGGKNEAECARLRRVKIDVEEARADRMVKSAAGGAKDALRVYEKAGDTYLELARGCALSRIESGQEPLCNRPDLLLWNAAEAYQSAHLLMKSIGVRKLLLDPRFKLEKNDLAKKSVLKLGGSFQAIAVYDEAAGWYERYAKEQPSADKADVALSDAIVLRLGLGQDDEALRNADLFMKTYGASRPVETAKVAFAIAAHDGQREDWDRVRRRLSSAMKLIDDKGALDVRMGAHALMGKALLRLKSDTAAGREYETVRALLEKPGAVAALAKDDPEGGTRRMAKALAAGGEALFYFAEKEKRKVDAITFPAYRGPGTKAAVLRHIDTAVKAWVGRKAEAIARAEKEYRKMADIQPAAPPVWVIAAASRVGGMWGDFVREFRAAPIPDEIRRDDELRNAYYEALDRASEPQKLRARSAFEGCLAQSVTHQYFDAFSRACEVWLAKTYKDQYHRIDELRAAADHPGSGLSDRPPPLDVVGKPLTRVALTTER